MQDSTTRGTTGGRTALIALNVGGGAAVLASYVHGLGSPHAESGAIWGGVPERARGLYTTSMLLAASGYFPFTGLFVFGIDWQRTRFGSFRPGILTGLYALVLVPSALWLPLTDAYLDAPSAGRWLAVVTVLLAAAMGSAGLLACLCRMEPRAGSGLRRLAIAGCLAFCFQTVVLDAVIWVLLFPT